ncbi:MAG: hypothetical protein IPO87_17885 [Flavobacteriales bacterium]|nr:hypothetical protein [Flavobacteriales bacterium]
MAEFITIKIIVTPEAKNLLQIPALTLARRASSFNGTTLVLQRLRPFNDHGLIFTLYFAEGSPFQWSRQFLQVGTGPATSVTRLAEEVAHDKGHYKYGVSVVDAQTNKPLYDEIPYWAIY